MLNRRIKGIHILYVCDVSDCACFLINKRFLEITNYMTVGEGIEEERQLEERKGGEGREREERKRKGEREKIERIGTERK